MSSNSLFHKVYNCYNKHNHGFEKHNYIKIINSSEILEGNSELHVYSNVTALEM